MKKHVAAITIGVAAVALAGCNVFDSKMTKLCEGAIQKRLRSPSTYERVEITPAGEKKFSDRQEFLNYLADNEDFPPLRSSYIGLFDAKKADPTVYALFISYDAQNAYGAPVRDHVMCDYFSIDGSPSDVSESNVKIDGKTHIEWLVDQASN